MQQRKPRRLQNNNESRGIFETTTAAAPMQHFRARHLRDIIGRGSNATSLAILIVLNIVGHSTYTTSLAVNPTQHVRHKKVDGELAAAHTVGLGNRLSILNFIIVR